MSVPNPENLFHPAPPADGFDDVGQGRTIDADVVIVGTGPGGASAGRVLSTAGKKVVFLEEGPPQSRFRPNQAHTMRYHMQEGGMIVARGSGFLPIAAGRGVGGGTGWVAAPTNFPGPWPGSCFYPDRLRHWPPAPPLPPKPWSHSVQHKKYSWRWCHQTESSLE